MNSTCSLIAPSEPAESLHSAPTHAPRPRATAVAAALLVALVAALGLLPAAAGAASLSAPAAPTVVTAAPGNAAATVSGRTPADHGSAISAFVVTPYMAGLAQPAVTFPVSSAPSTFVLTVSGLTNGSAYTFRVAATNGNGTGPQSVASAAITVGAPTTPAPVTATPANAGAHVTWHISAANAAPVSDYVVTPYVGTTPGSPVTVPAPTGSAVYVSTSVSGLANGTQVIFKVAAVNAEGSGPTAVSGPVFVGAPFAPSAVTAAAGQASATVTWKSPTDNGSVVTSYTVTPYIGSAAQTATTVAAPATVKAGTKVTTTVGGLTAGVGYTFRVSATNANGTGARSLPSSKVTPTA